MTNLIKSYSIHYSGSEVQLAKRNYELDLNLSLILIAVFLFRRQAYAPCAVCNCSSREVQWVFVHQATLRLGSMNAAENGDGCV
jgi:hypothetical protein